MRYTVKDQAIELEGGKTVSFPFPIGDVIETEAALVIALKIPVNKQFNENVFAINYSGEHLWQVKPVPHSLQNSPYVGLTRQGELVRLHNYDGMIYDVDPRTGKIISELLAR